VSRSAAGPLAALYDAAIVRIMVAHGFEGGRGAGGWEWSRAGRDDRGLDAAPAENRGELFVTEASDADGWILAVNYTVGEPLPQALAVDVQVCTLHFASLAALLVALDGDV
jgi:hypothetical protein